MNNRNDTNMDEELAGLQHSMGGVKINPNQRDQYENQNEFKNELASVGSRVRQRVSQGYQVPGLRPEDNPLSVRS